MTIAINDLLNPAAEEILLKDSWVPHTQKLTTKTKEFYPRNDKLFELVEAKKNDQEEEEEANSDSRSDSDDEFELIFDRGDTPDNQFEEFEDGWTDTEPQSDDEEEEYESDEEQETVASSVETPFWWSYEEPDQIKAILDGVTKFLKLDIEAANCVREPKPYITCIKRISVSFSNNTEFQTFDRVYICRRCTVAPGTPFPFVRKEYILTTWDREEGLPKDFVCVTPKTKRACKNQTQSDKKASCLYCLPQLFSGEDNLFASNQKLPFTYLHSTTVFDEFLPKEKESEEEEEEGEVRDEENPLV